jgi:hypothetical protein
MYPEQVDLPERPVRGCGSGRWRRPVCRPIERCTERHADFVRLQERLDPRGAFRNQWLKSHVLGDT